MNTGIDAYPEGRTRTLSLNQNTPMKAIGYLTVSLIAAFFGSIWSGYALSTLWQWFAVPTFGLPALTVPAAIGVGLIVSYLTYQADLDKDDKNDPAERLVKHVVWMAVRPAFALLGGWIVTFWM